MFAKGTGRKLFAFVLAFAMAIASMGVKPVTVKAGTDQVYTFSSGNTTNTTNSTTTNQTNQTTSNISGSALKLQYAYARSDGSIRVKDLDSVGNIYTEEGKLKEAVSKTQTLRMEVNDTFSLYIASGTDLKDVATISLNLNYNSEYFGVLGASNLSLVGSKGSNKTLMDVSGWSQPKYYEDTCKLDITTADTYSTIYNNTRFVKIDFTVKKAVENTTEIGLSNIVITTGDSVAAKKTIYGSDVTSTLQNSVANKRSFVLSVPEKFNLDANSDDSITTLAVKVVSDPVNFNVYCQCQIAITYDATVLDFEGIDLSAAIKGDGASKNAVSGNESPNTVDNLEYNSGDKTITNGQSTVRYSIVKTSDINVFDQDFIYVKFSPKNGNSKTTNVTSTSITLTLEEVNNISRTSYQKGKTGFKYDSAAVSSSGISTSDISKTKKIEADLTYDNITKGDVNCDGYINLIDVTDALRFYNGDIDLSSKEKSSADVDGKNGVTLADAVMILKYVNSGSSASTRTKPTGWVDD
jgi:hypothetical protein